MDSYLTQLRRLVLPTLYITKLFEYIHIFLKNVHYFFESNQCRSEWALFIFRQNLIYTFYVNKDMVVVVVAAIENHSSVYGHRNWLWMWSSFGHRHQTRYRNPGFVNGLGQFCRYQFFGSKYNFKWLVFSFLILDPKKETVELR